MKVRKPLFLMVPMMLIAALVVFAQQRYNAADETTLKGTVDDVQHVPHGAGTGMHLIVKNATGTTTVALGPQRFVDQNKFTFAKGDQVEVTGSKSGSGKTSMMIAREVKKGGQTLTLRDNKGVPKWLHGHK